MLQALNKLGGRPEEKRGKKVSELYANLWLSELKSDNDLHYTTQYMESQMVQNSRNKIGLTFNKIIIKVKTDFSQAQQNQFTFNKITSSLSRNYLSRARDIESSSRDHFRYFQQKIYFNFTLRFISTPNSLSRFNNLTFQGQAANAVNNPILCQQPCQALSTS